MKNILLYIIMEVSASGGDLGRGFFMYSFNDIADLLSKQARSLLTTNHQTFDVFEPQAAEVVKNIVTVTTPPQDFVKLPFVWILEYLLMPQFSGQSAEYIKMVSDHYSEALKILEGKDSETANSTSAKVVDFSGMYSLE